MQNQRLTPWRRTARQTTINTPWLKVHSDVYTLPNGKELDGFYVVEEPSGVNIVVLTKDKKVLLVRQYRAAVDGIVHDFPAGFVEEDGQPLLEQAKRELKEETGYEAEEWYELGKAYALPNRSSKVNHFFLALNAEPVDVQKLDETEFIKYELVPLAEVKRMIAEGEFTCGVCMSSLLQSLLKLEQIG